MSEICSTYEELDSALTELLKKSTVSQCFLINYKGIEISVSRQSRNLMVRFYNNTVEEQQYGIHQIRLLPLYSGSELAKYIESNYGQIADQLINSIMKA